MSRVFEDGSVWSRTGGGLLALWGQTAPTTWPGGMRSETATLDGQILSRSMTVPRLVSCRCLNLHSEAKPTGACAGRNPCFLAGDGYERASAFTSH